MIKECQVFKACSKDLVLLQRDLPWGNWGGLVGSWGSEGQPGKAWARQGQLGGVWEKLWGAGAAGTYSFPNSGNGSWRGFGNVSRKGPFHFEAPDFSFCDQCVDCVLVEIPAFDEWEKRMFAHHD